ncbi:LysR family transcriptional regulator [Virgibacillus halodenitrificans]|uniref:LysR family transcriptional regulator n=1 Tax=Virgibacillus halodenitrificans TaxID=1482 RepID=UPI001369F1C8|nr:LysR family transcriptional regulator [Virgibacillus halodenitrificans]MEC2160791.1 LysR family transcriptional regulator [Virgibacillus halodenitrificans]MYL45674.1 LysR family transcriptional regulator [Virgibacillus halodenitrificans]
MDLHLDYIKAIVKYGSISKAAKQLYISQPYLSQFIKTLENDLGAEIINRQTTPITLTYAGDRYLHYMDSILDLYDQMKEEMQGISHLKKGRLKVGVSPFLATYTLYKLLPMYMQKYPGIEVKLIEEKTETLENLLIRNQIDVCLNSLPITNDAISYEYLFEEYNYIVIPPEHHLHKNGLLKKETFDFSLLNGENFILAKAGLGLRRFTNEVFMKYRIQPNIVLETINAENALQLANSGIGITIVPQSVVENVSLSQKDNLYPLTDPAFKSHIVISFARDIKRSPAAHEFIKMAQSVCHED